MRSSSILVLGAVALLAFGCDAGEESELTQGSRLRRGTSQEAEEVADEEHDEARSEGESTVDPGNAAADARPAAPAEQGTPSPQFALKLGSATPTVNLGAQVDLDVTLEPSSGFSGAVEVSVSGLPAGVTAKPVTIAAGARTAKLTLEAAYTAVVTPKDKSVPLVITGKAGAAQATVNANFKVAPKMTLRIPMNIDALREAAGGPLRSEWGAPFGPGGQPLRTQAGNGIVISVYNADSKAHVIHGPGGAFPHGNTGAPIQPNAYEMQNGAVRTRTLNVDANVTGYPHDGANGQRASFNIKVAAAN